LFEEQIRSISSAVVLSSMMSTLLEVGDGIALAGAVGLVAAGVGAGI
jgi:hypothetical protein